LTQARNKEAVLKLFNEKFSTTMSGLRKGSSKEAATQVSNSGDLITQPNQMSFSNVHSGTDATRVALPVQKIIKNN